MCLRQNECSSNSDCLLSQSCANNVCVTNAACSGSSTATCDNNTDYVCQSGQCARVVDCETTESSTGCPADALCVGVHPTDESKICEFIGGCEVGASPLSDLACPAGATCSPNLNVCTGLVRCTKDADCNDTPQGGGLAYNCATSGKDAGYCVGSTQSCTAAEDCPAKSVCSSGVCVRDASCDFTTNNCGAGFVCLPSSKCAPEVGCSLADPSPESCPNGFVCSSTSATKSSACVYVGTCENGSGGKAECLMGTVETGSPTAVPNPFGVCDSVTNQTCGVSLNCNDTRIKCPSGYLCDGQLGVCVKERSCSSSGACPQAPIKGKTYDMACNASGSCTAILNCSTQNPKNCAENMRCVATKEGGHICQDVKFECTSQSDCPHGFECSKPKDDDASKYCIPSGGNCKVNSNCDAGYYCDQYTGSSFIGVCREVSTTVPCDTSTSQSVSYITCNERDGIPLSSCAKTGPTSVCRQCKSTGLVQGTTRTQLPTPPITKDMLVAFDVCLGGVQKAGSLTSDYATCYWDTDYSSASSSASSSSFRPVFNMYHRMRPTSKVSTCVSDITAGASDTEPLIMSGFVLTTASNTALYGTQGIPPVRGQVVSIESESRPSDVEQDLVLVPYMATDPTGPGDNILPTVMWLVPALERKDEPNTSLMPYYLLVGAAKEGGGIEKLVWVRDAIRPVTTFQLSTPDVIDEGLSPAISGPYNMAVGSGAGLSVSQSSGKERPSPMPAPGKSSTQGFSGQQAFMTSVDGFETTTNPSADDLLLVYVFDSVDYSFSKSDSNGIDPTTPVGLIRGVRTNGIPQFLNVYGFVKNPSLTFLCGMNASHIFNSNGEATAGLGASNDNYKETQNITRLFWTRLTYHTKNNDLFAYWDTTVTETKTTNSNVGVFATLTRRPFPYAPATESVAGFNAPDGVFSPPGGSYLNLSFAGSGPMTSSYTQPGDFSYGGDFSTINNTSTSSLPSSKDKWDPRINIRVTNGSIGGRLEPPSLYSPLDAACRI